MTIASAVRKIEDQQFAGIANAASSITVFIDIVNNSSAMVELTEEFGKTPSAVDRIFERIDFLSKAKFDFRYENPFDVALCAYALAINAYKPVLGHIAAATITAARNAWWCTQVAAGLLQASSPRTTAVAISTNFVTNYPRVSNKPSAAVLNLLFDTVPREQHVFFGETKTNTVAASGFSHWAGGIPVSYLTTKNAHLQWHAHG